MRIARPRAICRDTSCLIGDDWSDVPNGARLGPLIPRTYPQPAHRLIGAWLDVHPHVHQVFIPVGACWLNHHEAWWRLFRREAVAGKSFVDADEIDHATRAATAQFNRRAKPWVWNRPPGSPRYRRHTFLYRL